MLAAPRIALGASLPDFSGLAYDRSQAASFRCKKCSATKLVAACRCPMLFGGKPLILVLGYFHCPNLCGVVRADLFDALQRVRDEAGRDYSLVALSIDP